MVGPWPIVLQLAIVVISAIMIFEASDYSARIVTLRDFLLLVAAVVVGLLLYDYISTRAAALTDVLVNQWSLQTDVQLRIADAVPFCLAAMAVGTLLVLMAARLAEEPQRLALYLSFALPLVYLIIMVSSLTFLYSLRESIVSTFRIFAVVGVAFAAGCLLGGRLLRPKHSSPK
jgi:hypothetical protein